MKRLLLMKRTVKVFLLLPLLPRTSRIRSHLPVLNHHCQRNLRKEKTQFLEHRQRRSRTKNKKVVVVATMSHCCFNKILVVKRSKQLERQEVEKRQNRNKRHQRNGSLFAIFAKMLSLIVSMRLLSMKRDAMVCRQHHHAPVPPILIPQTAKSYLLFERNNLDSRKRYHRQLIKKVNKVKVQPPLAPHQIMKVAKNKKKMP
mmetsp:Transcript_4919/g.5606  ORF Transcript_4919/g.5606 Transcript_4919/m.5606 type:complete len:201 (+) Transcript_4919:536-1138(+)